MAPMIGRIGFLAVLFCLAISSVQACSVPPGPSRWEKSFRSLIDRSDYVFIGRVGRIIRRRWGPDDELGPHEARWLKSRAKGRKIHPNIQNRLDFSDSIADISVFSWLKEPSGSDKLIRRGFSEYDAIQIDLLRPFTVVGRGPCYSFPRTCPWTVRTDDFVAIAINKRINPVFWVQYCVVIEHPNLKHLSRIRAEGGSSSAGQLFRQFIKRPGGFRF